MDNKTSLIAINKFMYFMYNFPYDFIVKVWGPRKPYSLADHLAKKFDALYERKGAYGVIPAFYAELDGNNRKKLLEWVMDNFNGEQKLRFEE